MPVALNSYEGCLLDFPSELLDALRQFRVLAVNGDLCPANLCLMSYTSICGTS